MSSLEVTPPNKKKKSKSQSKQTSISSYFIAISPKANKTKSAGPLFEGRSNSY